MTSTIDYNDEGKVTLYSDEIAHIVSGAISWLPIPNTCNSGLTATCRILASRLFEGVINHCTEMEVDRQYVDSHGQSTIAFAFCLLLGFQLLPRLKAIHSQKLCRPETDNTNAYANLQQILTKPIDWGSIRQQYGPDD